MTVKPLSPVSLPQSPRLPIGLQPGPSPPAFCSSVTGVSQKSVPVEVLAHDMARSYLPLLTWRLDHDLPYTAKQMDAMFEQLVIPGIREMLWAAR